MRKAINREYADRFGNIARCTVERLMRQLGVDGVRRRRKRPKTASARAEECPEDLVEREFTADGPNCLWVADITYIPTPWILAIVATPQIKGVCGGSTTRQRQRPVQGERTRGILPTPRSRWHDPCSRCRARCQRGLMLPMASRSRHIDATRKKSFLH
ncbi:hypothetical protein EB834_02495 [Brevibacterium aurantiacum]|uniref:HTH-like domain-containing protein n=1 Tax=Brevibacterium aurantiacum TaxID=273384 RepID=A0A4Z0KPV9_BREAU|nr:hypothetical protein EB834_02495 [Brevibacterium aurantiacum]